MRKISSIFFLVVAGFFIYMASFLAFSNFSVNHDKFELVGIFSLIALITMFIGLIINKFQHWKRKIGITLISGASVTATVIFTFVCIMISPDYQEFFPRNELGHFNDYTMGSVITLVFAGVGIILFKLGKHESS